MLLGYARVSTEEENFDRQINQLKDFGISPENIYTEKISSMKKNKPVLLKLLAFARENDTIIISELTRIVRNTKELISLVEELGNRGINIKSLKESWFDTSTAQGKQWFMIVAPWLVQFARNSKSDKTKEGLKSARIRGKNGGRPAIKRANIDKALKLYDQKVAIQDICDMCQISKNTLYNYIRQRKDKVW